MMTQSHFKIRLIKLRRDRDKTITLHKTQDHTITYKHTLKNGMVGWNIQRDILGKDSEILSGGYALANRQAEMYINSEIIRISGEAKGMRWC